MLTLQKGRLKRDLHVTICPSFNGAIQTSFTEVDRLKLTIVQDPLGPSLFQELPMPPTPAASQAAVEAALQLLPQTFADHAYATANIVDKTNCAVIDTIPGIRVGDTLTFIGFVEAYQDPPKGQSSGEASKRPLELQQKQRSLLMHFLTYGQQGYTPSYRITAGEARIEPFIEPRSSAWHVALEPHQLPILLLGFRPRGMEDKWFVYADGPDVDGHVRLHMHQVRLHKEQNQAKHYAPTAYKSIELIIDAGAAPLSGCLRGSAAITGIVWESSPTRIKEQNEEKAKEMAREVCKWILSVELKA